ncbi:MAG: IscS subfamily cysteine desulfurase [Phaeodactylibacter sp.]|nr:IscS subfamily cysteine desulfurase [Phaeodactylibacter sp.]MCB9273902.1 IscS subfamily cysteine desulfurase [Lewinellaceae bacterium]
MPAPLIYLDNNATTPCDPRALEVMLPYFFEMPGNAASRNHPFGWMAEEAVKQAREQVALLIGAETRELVFTSGATESDNLAIKGVFELYRRKGSHIITLKTEHKAVLDTCRHIEKMGGEVTYLDVDENGLVNLGALEAAIRPDTILVSVMWANNETGVIQPIAEIGAICDKFGVLFMSDATQATGKIPVNPREAGVHLMAFSAHKLYGPKGIGALYISRRAPRVKVAPIIDGGGHEQGMRSGTLNVPAIVGFGKAAELAAQEMPQESRRLRGLRDKLESTLLGRVEEAHLNGSRENRLPHVSNIAFRYAEAESVLMTFNQRIALSSGSACTSASIEPSHVLTAMGRSADWAHSALRFSLGRFNTEEEVEQVITAVAEGVEKVRGMSPVWELFKEGNLDG